MKHYKYRTIIDWTKGVTAMILLFIGDVLNNTTLIGKAIEIAERLVVKYVGINHGSVNLGFTGFTYQKLEES